MWLKKALYTRAIFDRNAQMREVGDVKRAIEDATMWLKQNKHPDPYTSQRRTHSTSPSASPLPSRLVLPHSARVPALLSLADRAPLDCARPWH